MFQTPINIPATERGYPPSWGLSVVPIVLLVASYITSAMDGQLFSMLLPWITKSFRDELECRRIVVNG
jgi:hypothetical protein